MFLFQRIQILEKEYKKDFKGKEGDVSYIIGKEKKLLFGLGKESELTEEKLKRLVSFFVDVIKSKEEKIISIEFFSNMDEKIFASALAESLIMSNYIFSKYKKSIKKKTIDSANIIASSSCNSAVNRSIIIASNNIFVRDIINDSPSVMNTEAMEKVCKQIAKTNKTPITIIGDTELKKKNLNLIHAVGKGATIPPRLIIMEHIGNPKNKEKIAIVGKGITFDSGGINLKPSGHIEDMKCDKSGAASVLAIIKSLNELKSKVNVIAVMPFCENMIGPDSYKPGDILTAYDGTTVEVGNTDAEGRLVLGDAVAYVKKNYKPDMIIDIATLTGSAAHTFGDFASAAFSNDKKLMKMMFDAGEKTGERVWELPLYDDYVKDSEGPNADIMNVTLSRDYGAINGALFVKHFVGKTKWLHIDMAGPAFHDKKRWHYGIGASGWGVRIIMEFLRNFE